MPNNSAVDPGGKGEEMERVSSRDGQNYGLKANLEDDQSHGWKASTRKQE